MNFVCNWCKLGSRILRLQTFCEDEGILRIHLSIVFSRFLHRLFCGYMNFIYSFCKLGTQILRIQTFRVYTFVLCIVALFKGFFVDICTLCAAGANWGVRH